MPDIQKADPKARRQAVGATLVCAAIGFVAIGGYSRHEAAIFGWIERNLDFLVSNPEVVLFFGLLLVSPLLLFSAFLFFYARRAARARRIPPPGCSVVRDTVVTTGSRALLKARAVQFLALLLLLGGALIPFFMWLVITTIGDHD